MGNEEFLRICKAKVADYYNDHVDKTDGNAPMTVDDVFVARLRSAITNYREGNHRWVTLR